MSEHEVAYALGPALEFLQGLWRLNHGLERRSHWMERHLGVTVQQRVMVRCIGKYPGLTAAQLASMLHLDRGTVSASLKGLAAKGLIERRRDPKDKRRVFLGLTEAGRGVDRPTVGTVEHAVAALLESTDPSMVLATRTVLDRLAALLAVEEG